MFKNIITIAVFALLGMACSKSDMAPATTPEEEKKMTDVVIMTTNNGNAGVKGNFGSAAHTTTGKATVYTDKTDATKRSVVIEEFKTDAGPDLRVYLAEDLKAANHVELAKLPKTSGSFTLDIPSKVDLAKQKYLLIWCEDFSVLFGSVKLE
jgi:hypothetical protein